LGVFHYFFLGAALRPASTLVSFALLASALLPASALVSLAPDDLLAVAFLGAAFLVVAFFAVILLLRCNILLKEILKLLFGNNRINEAVHPVSWSLA